MDDLHRERVICVSQSGVRILHSTARPIGVRGCGSNTKFGKFTVGDCNVLQRVDLRGDACLHFSGVAKACGFGKLPLPNNDLRAPPELQSTTQLLSLVLDVHLFRRFSCEGGDVISHSFLLTPHARLMFCIEAVVSCRALIPLRQSSFCVFLGVITSFRGDKNGDLHGDLKGEVCEDGEPLFIQLSSDGEVLDPLTILRRLRLTAGDNLAGLTARVVPLIGDRSPGNDNGPCTAFFLDHGAG